MHFPVSRARSGLSEILNEVAFRGERVVLQRHGKDVAAVIPIEDYELLEQLEDRIDLDLARKALREKQSPIAFKKLKQKLGL